MRICNPPPGLLLGFICVSALTLLYTGGCASNKAAREASTAKNGIEEYRQIATRADQAIHRALDSLAAVAAQSNRCSPEPLRSFSAEIQSLQVESLEIRARSQAIQARGDAYFERWDENMAHVKNAQLRQAVEKRQPELQQSFRRIKELSQEAREAFNPFLADLRQLRNALEKDPGAIGALTTRNDITQATDYGQRVEKSVAGILRELDSMATMLLSADRPSEN